MKTPATPLTTSVLLLSLICFVSGCVTPAVWKQTAAHKWKPTSPDKLLFLPTTGASPAVIACFAQFTRINDQHKFRPVAWCLGQPPNPLLATGDSARHLTNRFTGCQSMPLFTGNPTNTNLTTTPPGYAVWDWEARQLTIHLDGFPPGPYPLPISYTEVQTTTRVIVLPFAVVADAALACLAILALGASGGGYH
jgi:hypothetical protein